MAFHVWFCRRHGSTWYAVEDPERYVALSKQTVGHGEPPKRAPRVTAIEGVELPRNMAIQCEGERPTIEWRVDLE